MHFSIIGVDKPNSLDLRMANRPAHLDYLAAHKQRIVAAGASLAEDGQTMVGTILLIEAADRAAAERFSAEDPFTQAGLFASVTIQPWRKGYPKG